MPQTLLHIWGPISIHSYGAMIAIGLLIFIYLIQKDPRFTKIGLEEHLNPLLILGIITAFVGGRILYLFSHPTLFNHWYDLFSFWEPGFSILGSVLALLVTAPFYLHAMHIPAIPLLDLVTLYAPLLQSISRLGCYLAGCCFGAPTQLPWAITYNNSTSIAPLYVCLHPTQLYSSFLLFLCFVLLYFVIQKRFKKPGQLACWYVILSSSERFLVDFYRGDLVHTSALPTTFTFYQYIALGMIGAAIIGLIYFSAAKTK